MRKYLNSVMPTSKVRKTAVVFEEDEQEIIPDRRAAASFLRDTQRKSNQYFVNKAVKDFRSDFAE